MRDLMRTRGSPFMHPQISTGAGVFRATSNFYGRAGPFSRYSEIRCMRVTFLAHARASAHARDFSRMRELGRMRGTFRA